MPAMAPRPRDLDEHVAAESPAQEDQQSQQEQGEEEQEDYDVDGEEGQEDDVAGEADALGEDDDDETDEELKAFLRELREYHEKRGLVSMRSSSCLFADPYRTLSTFDPHPKVGSHPIHLLNFYKKILSEGGYDRVSDTKGNKLAWRRVVEEFMPKANGITLAFLVKTVYYKNLA
jgi:hypothetical protein